ncbi:hypothetical protein [Calothrix sp. 336/3]|uniref:hypothetical protein n=1 Tax=Calothrix sp. 336/3 TaxID=1337936 RepID=UPI0004E3566A|nr:hypothetical protein [Calothrix sp. 336/3]AKG19994.1 hypothetical protein IJ00_00525 [Calothrix sp. 336/3]
MQGQKINFQPSFILKSVTAINWFFAALPNLTLLGIWLMSWRASVLLSRIPRINLDDPKNIGENDLIYQVLIHATYLPAIAFYFLESLWAIFAFSSIAMYLRWHQRSRISHFSFFTPLILFIIGYFIFKFDPGQRVEWFLD